VPASGVLAIVRLREHEPCDAMFDALAAADVDAIEVTLPTPGSVAAVRRWVGRTSAAVGVGTVRTWDDAAVAMDAGAQFIVSPTFAGDVVAAGVERSVPVVCGALSPTEIDGAWQQGATAVKVFPVGTVGGPAYVRAVREPLDDVPLLPTGGVTVESAQEYARLGCVGIGVGGALVSEDVVADRRWSELTSRAGRLVAAWRAGVSERG
jgi:2-dehydro-3-deoxyphosphogluconate aldolase/(4S)-4-hydroxy-2-oxoglutarate aldolase